MDIGCRHGAASYFALFFLFGRAELQMKMHGDTVQVLMNTLCYLPDFFLFFFILYNTIFIDTCTCIPCEHLQLSEISLSNVVFDTIKNFILFRS